MNTEYVIEKNIDIPNQKRRSTSPLSLTLQQMEAGDSVVMTQRERNAAFAIANYLKIKLASRRIDNDRIRVWRVK
jgi:hypothetical protein